MSDSVLQQLRTLREIMADPEQVVVHAWATAEDADGRVVNRRSPRAVSFCFLAHTLRVGEANGEDPGEWALVEALRPFVPHECFTTALAQGRAVEAIDKAIEHYGQ